MRYTTSFCQVKSFLNLVYATAAASLLYEAASTAAEQRSIARNEAAKTAPRDPAEIEAYRLRLWFQNMSDQRRVSHAGGRAATKAPTRKKPCDHGHATGFFGSKFGRASFSTGAPYRRGAM